MTVVVATTGTDTPNCQPGPCRTITHAINIANPGDTISIMAGTYNLPVEIFPLTINKNLTVTGAGAGSTILDATNANQRVITVNSGSTAAISGVTITHGISGAIGPSGSGPGGGGGIRNDGILTLDNSTVSNNSGGYGIFSSGTLTLNNSTVSGNVGGIFNNGAKLILNNSTVSGNNGGNSVGGIYNSFGTLTLTNSTVSGNKGGGGGIRNSAGTTTLNSSTVSGNQAGAGGGIGNDCSGGGQDTDHFVATLILINSTVSGNTASNYGGGILNQSSQNRGCFGAVITLSNSTVSGNSAGTYGGGLAQDKGNTPNTTIRPATITLKNSIVAGNTGNPAKDCDGTITSLGDNIAGDASCALSGTGDKNNTNPMLGPLASNGGPTLTHAPLAGSPAINAVPPGDCKDANGAPISTDQRGVARPQGAACDIGSVEAQTAQLFEYAVKFVCGRALSTAPAAPQPVAPGTYYTAINVHNPNSGTINFTKKFARALPNQQAGAVTQFFPATLKADQAFEIECAEITNKLQMPPLSFVTGFAVLQSADELDIVAVYPAASSATGAVVTMYTERVPKRP